MDPMATDLKIGIVGAGAMGAGIAQIAAAAGIGVVLYDLNGAAAAKARDAILGRLARLVEKGSMTTEALAQATEKLVTGNALSDLAACGLVVEAVIEDLEIKRKLFADLEAILADDAVLASNTSSLPIAAIARTCRNRSRIAGLHFFNPVPLMKLVEIIPAVDTAPELAEKLVALVRRLGHTPVVVRDAPGFLVNAAGRAFYSEGLAILNEGVADVATIDAIMRDMGGFRMGPFELMDLTGMDVNFPASKVIFDGFFNDARLRTTPLHQSLFTAGRLGRKTGAGWHRYDTDGKPIPTLPVPAPTVAAAGNVALVEADDALTSFAAAIGLTPVADDGTVPLLAYPLGEDCTSLAHRLGLDHGRLVAVDLFGNWQKRVTIMTAPGADASHADSIIAAVQAKGLAVSQIRDSAGFVFQREIAMVINLSCELAQIGTASPADIDLALTLGLNYPKGTISWGDVLGLDKLMTILTRIQAITGDDRYRPSQWLRRRALLNLPAATLN